MANQRLPDNWPPDIKFVKDSGFPERLRSRLYTNDPRGTHPRVVRSRPATPSNLVRIQKIKVQGHPCYGQLGVFATKFLPEKSFIMFYEGIIHDRSDGDMDSDYDVGFDRLELGWLAIDAEESGNEARFCNDYRDVANEANAELKECLFELAQEMWRRMIGVFVLGAGIKKGEEILFDYGEMYWKERERKEWEKKLEEREEELEERERKLEKKESMLEKRDGKLEDWERKLEEWKRTLEKKEGKLRDRERDLVDKYGQGTVVPEAEDEEWDEEEYAELREILAGRGGR